MSRRLSRSAACTPLAVMVLTLTACGSSEPPANAATPTTAEPAVAEATPEASARPKVTAPTVAPLQIDDSVFNLYGSQEMVETAYGEVVELATDLAFNPDFVFLDGDNAADDLAPILERVSPEQGTFVRAQADGCLAADPQSCANVYGLAFFDWGTAERPYTFREDLEFVTEQSITNPKAVAVIPNLGTSYLEVSFDHAFTMRFMIGGTPVVGTMTRHLTYNLDPAGGPSTQWLIHNWHTEGTGDLTDEATGGPIAG